MYFVLSIAILTTLYWLDSLIIKVVNTKINPYKKSSEDEEKEKTSTIVRLISMFLASLFWGAVFVFWK